MRSGRFNIHVYSRKLFTELPDIRIITFPFATSPFGAANFPGVFVKFAHSKQQAAD